MKYWFTSDTHFNHTNIIKYCNRPFKSIEHMNRELIRRWNERVKPDDIVYHLGDFCFKEKDGIKAKHWFEQLNGNIILLEGNHDDNNSAKSNIQSMIIEMGGKTWWLSHYPNYCFIPDMIVLHGHVHDLWKVKIEGKQIFVNVGVDVWNFYPINIHEIIGEIEKTKYANKNI